MGSIRLKLKAQNFPKLQESAIGFNKPGLPDLYDDFPHLSVIHIHTGSGHEKHIK